MVPAAPMINTFMMGLERLKRAKDFQSNILTKSN